MTAENPVDMVLRTLNCTQADLSRAMGVSRAVISIWKTRGGIPAKRVKRLSEVTGIAPFLLCPEYFPTPTLNSIGGAAKAPALVDAKGQE